MGARRVIGAMWIALLGGCATATTAPPVGPPPFEAAEAIEQQLGRTVSWGGMVIETRNFERHSEIEVVAFPLDRRGAPLPDQRDLGRFVLLRAGFLDPQLYAPGRFVTADGRITGDRRGQVRSASYVWPELDAATLTLWPSDFRSGRGRVHFSIGIGLFH